jgi:hypothetical protein
MSAGYQELFMEQGTTFNTTIELDDVYGESYNLQNYSASSEMRKSYYSSNATAVFNTTVNGTNGQILINLSANQTANVYPGRYVYDIIIYNSNNRANTTIRVLEGIINVTPRVTRS